MSAVGVFRRWEQWANGGKLRGFGSVGIGNGFLGDTSVLTSYASSPTLFLSQIETQNGVFGRVEAGLSAKLTPNLALTSTYGGAFGKGRNQSTVDVGLSLIF